jgi:hypothetical protein
LDQSDPISDPYVSFFNRVIDPELGLPLERAQLRSFTQEFRHQVAEANLTDNSKFVGCPGDLGWSEMP